MNKYIIYWYDRKTGNTGHGDPLEHELASEWMKFLLNYQYPGFDFKYWIVEDK